MIILKILQKLLKDRRCLNKKLTLLSIVDWEFTADMKFNNLISFNSFEYFNILTLILISLSNLHTYAPATKKQQT